MTSRTPAEPAPDGAGGGTDGSPGERPGGTRAPEPTGTPAEPDTAAEELKPGDLGGQAPDVEPAVPRWSRLNGSAGSASATSGAAAGAAAADSERRRVPLWLVLVLALVGFAADQATKFWAIAALEPGSYRPLVGDLLGFQLVFNSGAAFSIAEGMTWVFTIVAAVVAVVIVRVARNLRSRAWAFVLAGLLGGTLGNLFDRLFREPGFGRGYVVDFINYNGYFVGNVADIFIVVAAIGMGVLTFIGIGFDGRRDSDRARTAERPEASVADSPAVPPGETARPATTATAGDRDESAEPADSSAPTEPAEPVEPAEAAEATEPAEPAEPAEPGEPSVVTEPDQTVEPAEPSTPAVPPADATDGSGESTESEDRG